MSDQETVPPGMGIIRKPSKQISKDNAAQTKVDLKYDPKELTRQGIAQEEGTTSPNE